ncbi:MAG: response regulator [Sedimenticola sp.]
MADILLVEDPMIRKMISLRLRTRGHQVDEAENGKLGMEAALSNSYDLVLLDMHMPVMDGYDAARNLRAQNYTGIIIAVTASAMSEETSLAIDAGCNHFIPKPIGPDFEQKIEAVMAGDAP